MFGQPVRLRLQPDPRVNCARDWSMLVAFGGRSSARPGTRPKPCMMYKTSRRRLRPATLTRPAAGASSKPLRLGAVNAAGTLVAPTARASVTSRLTSVIRPLSTDGERSRLLRGHGSRAADRVVGHHVGHATPSHETIARWRGPRHDGSRAGRPARVGESSVCIPINPGRPRSSSDSRIVFARILTAINTQYERTEANFY